MMITSPTRTGPRGGHAWLSALCIVGSVFTLICISRDWIYRVRLRVPPKMEVIIPTWVYPGGGRDKSSPYIIFLSRCTNIKPTLPVQFLLWVGDQTDTMKVYDSHL